jgi:hypothetical protein
MPEAEIVAADAAVRLIGIPCLAMWNKVLEREMVCNFHEDNAAMIQVCKTGKSPTMRHLGRTHRVEVHWLHEMFSQPYMRLLKEESLRMRADIFAKAFENPETWGHALEMIAHVDPKRFWTFDATAPPRIKVLDTPSLQGTGGDAATTEAHGVVAVAAPTAPTENPITFPEAQGATCIGLLHLRTSRGAGKSITSHTWKLVSDTILVDLGFDS